MLVAICGTGDARVVGTVSEACFAGSHSPWPPPLAPPAPQWPKPLCSSASQLLWRSLTSRDRASSATAPRLPDADRRLLPNGRSRDLPVPAQGASAHARVSDHAGSSDVRFSNRPFGVKHFQTIHQCGVDVARRLVHLFGICTEAFPSWDSRTRRNNLLVGLAVEERRVQPRIPTRPIPLPPSAIFPPPTGV